MDISVVIPTRNRAAKLRRTLTGLRAQTLPNEAFEVLVVDNGSTDDTHEVVSSFVGESATWKYVHEQTPGAAAARNRGVRAGQAEIVFFLDDDVIPDPPLLEEHWKSHRRQETVVLGSVRFPWKATESVFRRTLSRHPELLQSYCFPDPSDVPFQHFYTCNLSLPRAFLKRSGDFDEDFQTSGFEDIDMGYRLIRAGCGIVFNPRASAVHDCWLSFGEFAQKQRRTGRELCLLLKKHPELEEIFLPRRTARRRRLAVRAGAWASVFAPYFERPEGLFSFLTIPLLTRCCWLDLQRQFWQGFTDAAASPRP